MSDALDFISAGPRARAEAELAAVFGPVPELMPFLRLAATFLTDANTSSDAVLLLAEALDDLAEQVFFDPPKFYERTALAGLADHLRDRAPAFADAAEP